MVRVLGVEDGDGEDAAGLVAVLVLGLVEDVVLADAQDVARKLGGHHVLDLDVVGEDRLLPGDLKKVLNVELTRRLWDYVNSYPGSLSNLT